MIVAYNVLNNVGRKNKDKLSIPPTPPLKPIKNRKFNIHEERPLNENFNNPSFKGLFFVEKSKLLKNVEQKFGTAVAKQFEDSITRLTKRKNSKILIDAKDNINIKDLSIPEQLFENLISPVINLPFDLTNSAIKKLKSLKFFEHSKFFNGISENKWLKKRSECIEDYSNLIAIQHYAKMMEKEDDFIFEEGIKRCNKTVSNYSSKTERTLTRVVTGIIPAFYLANDAYNLSIYVNDNKKAAKEEKSRRFKQELARIGITAASTYGILGLFSKFSNSKKAATTAIIVAATFASEILGRAIAGTPFYPITKEGAKKYAKLQNKNLKQHNTIKIKKEKEDKKSVKDYSFSIIIGLILTGFAADMLTNRFRKTAHLIQKLKNNHKLKFLEDSKIEIKTFKEIMDSLNKKGFGPSAEKCQKIADKILAKGNLNAKDSLKLEMAIDDIAESKMSGLIIKNTENYNEAKKAIKKSINREALIDKLGLTRNNDGYLYINSKINKKKDVIFNELLSLPLKFAKTIVLMPYNYAIKPLYSLPIEGYRRFIKKIKPPRKHLDDKKALQYILDFATKENIKKPDFDKRLASMVIDSFDNVNKSNFSSADLAGNLKIAVSAVTSGFLIADNYNMVMIDSAGENTDLANQKAKERTIQRILRIAYGACIIKMFNGIFKRQYNSSLMKAQMVNSMNVFAVETLERKSVGLPIGESTRDEIIETDNNNINATGLKGAYFDFMSKITGKKALSKKK